MKAIFGYRPHDNWEKQWFVIKDDKLDKFDSRDITSPYNKDIEAQTVLAFYPIDNTLVTIFPAKSTQNKTNSNLFHFDKLYFIRLSNIEETEIHSSFQMYEWNEALTIVEQLKDLRYSTALKIWKMKNY